MRILVDTSYLYALMISADLFTASEREFVERRNARIVVSAASIWEMRVKYALRHPSGARKSPHDPRLVLEALGRQDVSFLPVTEVHAARSLEVPLPHKDPFDEMLLAQAQAEGMRLLTKDRLLVNHPLAITIP